MTGRINRCSHCGCDEPIYNAIDGKLYCDNCGMCLEKLEVGLTITKIDERVLECARALKEYCKGFGGECTGCLFDTKNDECAFSNLPFDWEIEDLSKLKAVELLKEMRENISGLDGNEAAKNKVTALTMAIEALEG